MRVMWEDITVRPGVRIDTIEVEAPLMAEALGMVVRRLMPEGAAFTERERVHLEALLQLEARIDRTGPSNFIRYDVKIS